MSRLELLVGALLALTVGIVLVFGGEPERESSLDTRPSTLRSGPDGSKAVYDVLVRLGVSTDAGRRHRSRRVRNAHSNRAGHIAPPPEWEARSLAVAL